jgi:RHS repeat-associated protein
LQPIQIGLGSSATSQNLLKLNFDYGGIDNNGNVKSQTITTPTVGNIAGFTATQNYTYDSLNRIKQAEETIPNQTGWKQTFIYDRYGNRTFDTANNNTTTPANGCPVAVCNPTANPNDNKLVGTNYDSVGNTKIDANGQVFTYDAENKQVQVNNSGGIVGQYFYDGDGKRIKKFVPSTSETTIFVYDASGKMVAEYSTVTASTTEAKISYLTSDTLGSPRVNTDANGQVIARHDVMPFGEEIPRANYGDDSVRNKFTSYQRDDETGLDSAKERVYSSNLGRFTSVDPVYISIKPINPQTFNRYSYVLNSPLINIDPFGLWAKHAITNKKGEITGYEMVASKDGDNAETLLGQLGYTNKDKDWEKMLKKTEGILKDSKTNSAGFSKLGKIDGDLSFFSNVETLLVAQARFDKKTPNTNDGPMGEGLPPDCSLTMASLTFSTAQINGLAENSTNAMNDADTLLKRLKEKSLDSLVSGDVVRYGEDNNRHFAKVLFKDDSGINQVFSRLGSGNIFAVTAIDSEKITEHQEGGKTRGNPNKAFGRP